MGNDQIIESGGNRCMQSRVCLEFKKTFGIHIVVLSLLITLSNSTDGIAYEIKLDPPQTQAAKQDELDENSDGYVYYTETMNTPKNPGICKLYLENLEYFSKNNIPIDCKRSVAPHLADRIREVGEIALDPSKNEKMLRALFESNVLPHKMSILKDYLDNKYKTLFYHHKNGNLIFKKMIIYQREILIGKGGKLTDIIYIDKPNNIQEKGMECNIRFVSNYKENFYAVTETNEVKTFDDIHNIFRMSQMFWIDNDLYFEGIMFMKQDGKKKKKIVLQEFDQTSERSFDKNDKTLYYDVRALPVCMYDITE